MRIVMLLVLVLCSTSAYAQVAIDEALTVDDTVGGVFIAAATRDPTNQDQAVYCRGVLEMAAIRMLDNGDAPTTAIGSPVSVNQTIEIFGHEFIQAARFIKTTGTDGLIHFTCYPRYPAWVGAR